MPRTTLFVACLAATLASPALAKGPPWIAIEYPANPHHESTRDAALLVRTYHHSTSLAMPVSGMAEGIVDGKRTSLKLDLRATNMAGVYALRGTLPRTGTWVLAISLQQGTNAAATALVTLDGKGGIARVEVPSSKTSDGWTVPRAVGRADIERALQVAATGTAGDVRGTSAGEAEASTSPLVAGMLGLPLLLIAFAGWRNRRVR
jgi:hypothetical protein